MPRRFAAECVRPPLQSSEMFPTSCRILRENLEQKLFKRKKLILHVLMMPKFIL